MALDVNGGLSPRVRGNRISLVVPRDGPGSIPACAGEPSWYPSRPRPQRVYPRVCGGTVWPRLRDRTPRGLSPRVRGNHGHRLARAGGGGSIPACAGEPARPGTQFRTFRVYPRVCGGTRPSGFVLAGSTGLSPRVRGNRYIVARSCFPNGSIPACAGEPVRVSVPRCRVRVYPRVCGGTHESVTGEPNKYGSIPACAGEPKSKALIVRVKRVYPRVCGGTATRITATTTLSGLSPRVRGNRYRWGPRHVVSGSIPACAGEPCRT